jgi:hypothetical protein
MNDARKQYEEDLNAVLMNVTPDIRRIVLEIHDQNAQMFQMYKAIMLSRTILIYGSWLNFLVFVVNIWLLFR